MKEKNITEINFLKKLFKKEKRTRSNLNIVSSLVSAGAPSKPPNLSLLPPSKKVKYNNNNNNNDNMKKKFWILGL